MDRLTDGHGEANAYFCNLVVMCLQIWWPGLKYDIKGRNICTPAALKLFSVALRL